MYSPAWYDPYPSTVVVYTGTAIGSSVEPAYEAEPAYVASGEAPVEVLAAESVQAQTDEAWISLATGAPDAMSRFARLVNIGGPADGLAEVGYAICSAMEGHTDRAEWAAKWALKEDPRVLERVPELPGVREAAAQALARYMIETRDRSGDPAREDVVSLLLELSRPKGGGVPPEGAPLSRPGSAIMAAPARIG